MPRLPRWAAAPGSQPRPRLVVFLGVRNATGTFMLSADGDQGFYMRDSFNAASDRIAIPIGLPTGAEIGGFKLDPETIAATDPATLDALARQSGGDQALAGTLVWSDAALGWIATWRLRSGGEVHEWRVSGVSFDEAFRNALRGAAQVLSGNGRPEG